jgi:hypothetical protein
MRNAKQRGAATLVVVMVLFFIISMVAAYTSRNMIFEQRTGANLYRATQSFEAAEAGMNWALMMLNSGRIDTLCQAAPGTANNSFRQRYLNIDPGTGLITPTAAPTPTCVFNGATSVWSCECLPTGTPSLTAPTVNEVSPAFRIRFRAPNTTPSAVQPGLVRIDVVGCTRLDNSCLDVAGASSPNEGRTVMGSVLMLSGRATSYPQAALTARGAVNASGLVVTNTLSSGSGITVHASDTINPGLLLTTSSGNALGRSTLDSDDKLSPSDIAASAAAPGISAAERFFAATFMLTPQRWIQMPGVVTVTCAGGACDAATVRTAIANNPGRPLWLTGGLTVDGTDDIADAANPVMMVVNGNLAFSTANRTIHGLLMLRPATGWDTGASTQPGTIRGAVVVDGPVTGTSSLQVHYDGGVLANLRTASGTFFRVAGSWRDWALP